MFTGIAIGWNVCFATSALICLVICFDGICRVNQSDAVSNKKTLTFSIF